MDTSQRLRWAVGHNRLSLATSILKRRPDLLVNADVRDGWSNLHHAASAGHYDMCVLLISLGHDQNEVSVSHKGGTALHMAAAHNHEKTLHYLSQHLQRAIDSKDGSHNTALMVACRAGHDPCVNLLLDFGADMDAPDAAGTRPIHIAAAFAHVKVLRTLVDRGADALTANQLGWTPMDYGANLKVQQYLRSLIMDYTTNHRSHSLNSQAPSTPVDATITRPFELSP